MNVSRMGRIDLGVSTGAVQESRATLAAINP
jgi:hypothetical protein